MVGKPLSPFCLSNKPIKKIQVAKNFKTETAEHEAKPGALGNDCPGGKFMRKPFWGRVSRKPALTPQWASCLAHNAHCHHLFVMQLLVIHLFTIVPFPHAQQRLWPRGGVQWLPHMVLEVPKSGTWKNQLGPASTMHSSE